MLGGLLLLVTKGGVFDGFWARRVKTEDDLQLPDVGNNVVDLAFLVGIALFANTVVSVLATGRVSVYWWHHVRRRRATGAS